MKLNDLNSFPQWYYQDLTSYLITKAKLEGKFIITLNIYEEHDNDENKAMDYLISTFKVKEDDTHDRLMTRIGRNETFVKEYKRKQAFYQSCIDNNRNGNISIFNRY